ncbi:EamA family transporter [Nakamurella sp. PAMC28650]|uniref:EamA family transporter n=1 Tax=Nakamurella sp. PAMC28650 TaxID=2762325 RepID=UPI00164D7940|nr:EamA family transporter [Nakamurella sp. PAMC28650]QNK80574.1 EamA family transporter [Nakamurella sp. PAMC28650]
MPGGVVAVVLAAAVLHVLWNTLVKISEDGYLATVLIAGGGALLCAAALPMLPAINGAAWINVLGSVVAQTIYYPLVAAAYRAGDMSQTYPLMRGTAPLLVAVVSGPVIGEHLTGPEWIGVGLICCGIWGIGAGGLVGRSAAPRTVGRRFRVPKPIRLALINAVVIATYTLIDGAGARASGAPATYTAWIFLFTALPMVTWTLIRRPRVLMGAVSKQWWVGIGGGVANVGAYGLVLWAMTRAPVAAVAALRETSILFATVTSVLILKEKADRYRIGAAVVIATGAIVLRLA